MRKLTSMIIVMAIGGFACGGEPFGRAGQESTEWIGAGAPETRATVVVPQASTTATVAPRASLVSISELAWHNDDLHTYVAETADDIIELVWNDSSGVDQYVQAHRASIAQALPGVMFPSSVPEDVSHVTSQLVYEAPSGQLDGEWVAAFGFWTAAPYTQTRAVGQRLVLRVGRNTVVAGEEDRLPCEVLAPSGSKGCADLEVPGLGGAAEVAVDGGVTLMWTQAEYRYELFHRNADQPEITEQIAAEMVELTEVERRLNTGLLQPQAGAGPIE